MSERFELATADPHWLDEPTLGRACERAQMTPRQAEATRYAGQGLQCGEIGERLQIPHQCARNLVEKAWAKMKPRLLMRARSRRYYRDLIDCHRNRQEGRAPSPLVGLLPHRNPNAEGKRPAADDYRTVSLRSPLVAPEDFDRALNGAPALLLLAEAAQRLSAGIDLECAA